MEAEQVKAPPASITSIAIEGRRTPHADEVEAAVLGAILIEKEALTAVKEQLQVKSFFSEAHQEIYSAILELDANTEPIDLITLMQILRRRNTIRKVGGTKYLAELISKINSAANIEYHASIVMQLSIKREMIAASSSLMAEAFDENIDIFTVLNNTEQYFFTISEQSIRRQYRSSSEIMKTTIDELEHKKLNNDGGVTGIPSGFSKLDAITGGWQKTELVIIAARPGMGKTAFVVTAMRNAAVEHKRPVAIFSLEMSATQLMLRLISAEAEIESEKLRKGTLQPHEWQQMTTRIQRLNSAPIYIDDTPALSILELRAKCRRLKAQFGIEMVIIDYLQLMSGDDGSNSLGSREQEIALISRSLKNLAKELEVPVLALSQLSRAVETRGGDKRPQLSDLRESGSIEQDADMVMFLYRPEYYKLNTDEDGNSTEGKGEVIIAKNRSGVLENIELYFIKEFTKFADSPFQSMLNVGPSGLPISDVGQLLSNFENASTSQLTGPTFLRSRANTDNNNDDNKLNDISPDDEVPF